MEINLSHYVYATIAGAVADRFGSSFLVGRGILDNAYRQTRTEMQLSRAFGSGMDNERMESTFIGSILSGTAEARVWEGCTKLAAGLLVLAGTMIINWEFPETANTVGAALSTVYIAGAITSFIQAWQGEQDLTRHLDEGGY